MTTFSQLADAITSEVNRPDMLPTICGFINQTIRELHSESSASGAAINFTRNLLEDQLTADVDYGFIWFFPRRQLYMRQQSVYYPGNGRYAKLRNPSSAYAFHGVDHNSYYYRAGNYLVFNGYEGAGNFINLAWFEYLRKLTYYTAALNPCTWDESADAYTYLPAYDVDDSTRAAAEALSTNWMCETYEELVKAGTRAKIYTRLSDTDRAKLYYSLYMSNRPGMVSAESYESTPVYDR